MKAVLPGVLFCLISLGFVGVMGASITTIDMGSADSFAVLAGSTVTNASSTNIHGDLGVSPGTAITGFPPGIVIGNIHSGDTAAQQAKTSLLNALNLAAGQPCGAALTGQDLGGLVLTPGVYCFASSAQLTGTLTLNSQGNPNAFFLIQIGSTLTTASGSSVVMSNSGTADNVFFDVGSSATLGTGTAFNGNILALTSITLNTGASIQCGRALAANGAVTLDSNSISIDTPGCEASASTPGTVPEPSTGLLLGFSLVVVGVVSRVVLPRRRVATAHT